MNNQLLFQIPAVRRELDVDSFPDIAINDLAIRAYVTYPFRSIRANEIVVGAWHGIFRLDLTSRISGHEFLCKDNPGGFLIGS
jgi:hypothetical protein